MNKPRLLAVALSASLVYCMAACKPSGEPAAQAEKAAALSLPDLNGKKVSLTDFAGKVVLVDFWATWCDPCKEEIPDLVKLHEKLASQGFTILGVSMDEEGKKAVKRFEKKQPIPYPVVLNGDQRAPEGWTVPGLPTAYLIGKDGAIVRRWFGEKDMDELNAAVQAALAAK